MPVLTYGSETVIWMERERSRNKVVQIDNFRGLLGIRRMDDNVPNARIRQLCGEMKGMDENIKGVLQWFGHVERMEIDRIAKRVYIGECAGSRSVGRPRKRWTDTVKDCLKKRGLDVRQIGVYGGGL